MWFKFLLIYHFHDSWVFSNRVILWLTLFLYPEVVLFLHSTACKIILHAKCIDQLHRVCTKAIHIYKEKNYFLEARCELILLYTYESCSPEPSSTPGRGRGTLGISG